MRDILGRIGGFLALAGVVSCVIQLVGYELRILRFLSEMDPLPAWGIRIGLIVVGGVLFFLSTLGEKAEADSGSPADSAEEPSLQALFMDSRFQALKTYIDSKVQASFDPAATPAVYQIVHAAVYGPVGPVPAADPGATLAVAYLKRQQEPQSRMQVYLDLRTGQYGETEMSALQWSSMVP